MNFVIASICWMLKLRLLVVYFQFCASHPCHLDKVFDLFVTTFWHLFGNFVVVSFPTGQSKYKLLCKAELTIIIGKPTQSLSTPPPTVLAFRFASWSGSYRKVVKKMSQSCHKLIKNFLLVATAPRAAHCKLTAVWRKRSETERLK